MAQAEEAAKIISEDSVSSLVAQDGAIPTTQADKDLSRSSENTELLSNILTQLKILNAYMAEGFNFTIVEEDIEEDNGH